MTHASRLHSSPNGPSKARYQEIVARTVQHVIIVALVSAVILLVWCAAYWHYTP